MKLLIAGLLAASTIAVAAPAAAQGIYIGPRGGVGVGVGADPYYGGGYDRGDDGFGEPFYQGRSVYRDPYNRGGREDGIDGSESDPDDIF